MQIICNNTNSNVTLALKSHLCLILKSLNLINNRVLHIIAILCILYMFYVTDLTLKLTSVLNCLLVHMK